MYDYLKNFDNFYKYYIELHNYAMNIAGDGIADIENIRAVHNLFSSVFFDILDHYGCEVDYVALMSDDKRFFDKIIVSVERHFNTGVKQEFLISGINIVVGAFCRMTVGADISGDEKVLMLENLRKISDAYKVVTVNVWSELADRSIRRIEDEYVGLLEKERERFFNYINLRKSLVVFVDKEGCITGMNRAAIKRFDIDVGRAKYNIMDVLDYHFISFDNFLKTYVGSELKPARLMNGEKFEINVAPIIIKEGGVLEYLVALKSIRRKTVNISSEPESIYASSSSKFQLTHTEVKICNMVESGLSSKEIADELHISIDTVKTHRKNIRKKLKLNKTGANMYIYLKQAGDNPPKTE